MDQLREQSVLVGMSGGVDSSVAALLLRDEGCLVEGATCQMLSDLGSEADDAREAAELLGIAHHVFDMREPFEQNVTDRFCYAYLSGKTPNPCIDCNRFVKFGALNDVREKMGFDLLATGHYVRREFDPERNSGKGRWIIKRALDAAKDQSYFLACLSQEQISHTVFPLGDMTKGEVRNIAQKANLRTAEKQESQDICFVPDNDYSRFIESHCEKSCSMLNPGPIVDVDGYELGQHSGLLRYTIGQRKGIGIAASHPLYVVRKDVDDNALIVGPEDALYAKKVMGINTNYVALSPDETLVQDAKFRVEAKTHYRMQPQPATATFTAEGDMIAEFDEPVRAPAPGQAIVLYDNDVVFAAATIDRSTR